MIRGLVRLLVAAIVAFGSAAAAARASVAADANAIIAATRKRAKPRTMGIFLW